MRTTVLCVIIGLLSVNVVAVVAAIGEPRKPITRGLALSILLINALIVVGVVRYVW